MSDTEKMLLWLADCQAATAEYHNATKSVSRHERDRHVRICQSVLAMIEQGFFSGRESKREWVIERLKKAIERGDRSRPE